MSVQRRSRRHRVQDAPTFLQDSVMDRLTPSQIYDRVISGQFDPTDDTLDRLTPSQILQLIIDQIIPVSPSNLDRITPSQVAQLVDLGGYLPSMQSQHPTRTPSPPPSPPPYLLPYPLDSPPFSRASARAPAPEIPYPDLPDDGDPSLGDDADRTGSCIICLDRAARTSYVPCGHANTCITCVRTQRPTTCPICKQALTAVIRLFFQ